MPTNTTKQVALVPNEQDRKTLDRAREKWPHITKQSDLVRQIFYQWLYWDHTREVVIENMITEKEWIEQADRIVRSLDKIEQIVIDLRTLNERIERKTEQVIEQRTEQN